MNKVIILVIFTLIKLIYSARVDNFAGLYVAEELGFGIKGVTHYLKHLLENCENVENLNSWIIFMESYLACEEEAWPYKPDEEKVLKTDQQLVQEFCVAWPNRFKCGVQLASRLDRCFSTRNENRTDGSDALRFSESYASLICQHSTEYLANLENTPGSFADRRSLICYSENKERIRNCIQQNTVLDVWTDFCTKSEIVQRCFNTYLNEASCNNHHRFHFLKSVFKQINSEFKCF